MQTYSKTKILAGSAVFRAADPLEEIRFLKNL